MYCQFIEEIVTPNSVRVTDLEALVTWEDTEAPIKDHAITLFERDGQKSAKFIQFPIFTDCGCGKRFRAEHCEDVCQDCYAWAEREANSIRRWEESGGF